MADFRLYKTAREALEDIWFYSLEAWGERQANTYLDQLYACFQKLAAKEKPWRNLPRELCVPSDVKHELYVGLERYFSFASDAAFDLE